MHGNLYGNIGQEVTKALELWLERYRGWESSTGTPWDRLSVSYSDVGGLKKQIEMMRETVETPLRHPELYKWLGLTPPRAILIHGPQGTGKNILTKAAATQAKATLHVLSLAPLTIEPSKERLRGAFQKAKETAPSVILIPDLRRLGQGSETAGDPSAQIASWLASEMDGLEEFSGVIVIGIASSPGEVEPSLRQRFDHQVAVDIPNRQGRYEILTLQTRKMPLGDDVSLDKLADMTDGCSGLFLWRVCQEAGLRALRRTLKEVEISDEKLPQEKLDHVKITMDDFLDANKSLAAPQD